MRTLACIAAATFLATLATPAPAQSLKAWCQCTTDTQKCRGTKMETGRRLVELCTPVIESGAFSGEQHVDALRSRATAYEQVGEIAHALEDLTEAVESTDSKITLWALYGDRGLMLYRAGLHELAIADFDKALGYRPGYPVSLWNRGMALAGLGKHDEAIEEYTRAMRGCDSCDFPIARGKSYAAKGQYDQALADFDRYLRRSPGAWHGLVERGIVYRIKRDYDRAIKDFDQAIKIEPKHDRLFRERGITHLAKGDINRALADFEAALALKMDAYSELYHHRDDASTRYYQAAAYRAKGNIDGAITTLGDAIRLDPGDEGTLNARGALYALKGDRDRALTDFSAAIKVNPKGAEAYLNRGELLRRSGDIDGAIADFTRLIEIAPNAADGYHSRGGARLARGEIEAALADLTRAVELSPKAAAPYVTRGMAYAVKGDHERAVAEYGEAIRLEPNPERHTLRAWSALKSGKAEMGMSDADRAIALQRDYAPAYVTRAAIHEAAGRKTAAIADLRQALTLRPAFAEAKESLTRLGAAP